jgi:hypothetical protein
VNAIILLNENNKRVETFTGSSGANGSPGRSNIPVVERFRGNDYIGIRITQNGEVTEVYINLLADGSIMHRNSIININGWETDAYITALTFPENADRSDPSKLSSVFISNGSYLRTNGKVILSSLSKVFMYAEKKGNTLNVQMDGQPLIEASLGLKASKVFVNDKPVDVQYDDDKMLLIDLGE